MKRVVIGAMVGKLTKIAQGLKITHARKAEVDMHLLARLVADAGGRSALFRDRLSARAPDRPGLGPGWRT
jgi:cobalamin biosynthesis protein CbiD